MTDRPALGFRAWEWCEDGQNLLSGGRDVVWPHGDEMLYAGCAFGRSHRSPARNCSCGVYSATTLDVVAPYLTPDQPVLGLVYASGLVLEGSEHTLRAERCRVAAIIAISDVFSLPRDELQHIAAGYQVPLLLDEHGIRPEDHRRAVREGRLVTLGLSDENIKRVVDDWKDEPPK